MKGDEDGDWVRIMTGMRMRMEMVDEDGVGRNMTRRRMELRI